MIEKNQPYLIGETAFHHEGDIPFLKTLVDHGKNTKIDAIKFHLLLDLDEYFVKKHEAYDILKNWLLTKEQWLDVLSYTNQKGLDTILLCNDPDSVDFAIENSDKNIIAIELHATGLNDYFLLEKASKFKGTVILGVGGSSIDEIYYAITTLNNLGQEDIFLMYGFQNYPTRYEEINLNKMLKLKDLFDLPVGYADHTDPSNPLNEYVSTLGMPLGINVCEKHFTHAFGEKRIDAQAAVTLEQLANIREMMDVANISLGDGTLAMSDAELSYGNTGPMKKAIVAKTKIKKGEVISLENVSFKRTNESTYMLQSFFPRLIGLTVNKDIEMDDFIDFSNVEYEFRKENSDQFKANK
ncbi:N-acetylneuraminate synthase family protein [uncultured Aquimarina sp.]|uniref:N-acetylneuraminate synthase family protein n=1 Tax=uncultured Aquimarina sp. TaxID=575652 RepID=UPI002617DA00|nr:N-acetylneuraminate synthase family protein [uncultured Aquimarina sp.]